MRRVRMLSSNKSSYRRLAPRSWKAKSIAAAAIIADAGAGMRHRHPHQLDIRPGRFQPAQDEEVEPLAADAWAPASATQHRQGFARAARALRRCIAEK